MGISITYGGYAGTYLQPPEAAEGVMDDAVCDMVEGGCGSVGEVDVVGDGEVWDWTCPDCGMEHTTYLDIQGEF